MIGVYTTENFQFHLTYDPLPTDPVRDLDRKGYTKDEWDKMIEAHATKEVYGYELYEVRYDQDNQLVHKSFLDCDYDFYSDNKNETFKEIVQATKNDAFISEFKEKYPILANDIGLVKSMRDFQEKALVKKSLPTQQKNTNRDICR